MTTVIKGKALRQDLNLYDGLNTTGQRKSSSGGYVQGNLIGDEVDVLMVHGQGLNRTQTVIQNCINSLGTLSRSIKFSPGTWTIESNTTIPANLTAIIPAGCVFSISAGITLTFSGPVKTDSDNFKTGSGTLTYTDDRMLQSVSGTNTITASTLSTLTGLKNGQEVFLVPANTITGAATLNINSTGAVNLRKNQSGGVVALVANDLIANNLYKLVYNSSGPYYMVSCLSSYAQGADIASATTINLDTATGDYVHVTGTTTITGITLKQGQERTLVFDGALTFTNGASLLLPGSADITTAANDTCVVRGEASGVVRCVSYQSKKDGPITVSSHQSYSRVFFNTGTAASAFDVDAVISTSTFESIGPTGAGATNTYDQLDNIPTSATAIIFLLTMQGTTTAGGECSITFYGRPTGSTTSLGGSIMAGMTHEAATASDIFGRNDIIVIPCDSSRRCDITWVETSDSPAVSLTYRGFCI
jgi:hypothetical protein